MKIHNIRFGFATNSSSSHSIILMNDGKRYSDNYDVESAYFGWENFTLASKEQKAVYLASQLSYALAKYVPFPVAAKLIKSYTRIKAHELIEIDHQSIINLPKKTYLEKYRSPVEFIDMEFFMELFNYVVKNKNILILGGNDNSDPHHLSKLGTDILKDTGYGDSISRKDPIYKYWTLFNNYNGFKVRLSFNDKQPVVTKAFAPELVDLKITDYCAHGCAFCYQGSSKTGSHAKHTKISSTIDALSQLGVFEIAIGGGEPTSHPDFLEILRQTRHRGIIPNFSTKSLGWLHDDLFRQSVMDNIGAFAFSTTSAGDVKRLHEIKKYFNIRTDAITIQTVPALFDNDYLLRGFIRTCAQCSFPVTLLGYKNNNRGGTFTEKKIDLEREFIPIVVDLHEKRATYKVGIDTCLASKCQDQLKEANIPSYLFSVKEGKFSMYVDAVNGKIGPSSFCDPSEMIDLEAFHNSYCDAEAIKDQILTTFAKW